MQQPMSKISKREKSETKRQPPKLNFSERFHAFRSDWDKLQSNVLSGDALSASKRLSECLADSRNVTEFLVEFLRSFVFDLCDCHPARFLKLAIGASERWAEDEQHVLGDVLSLVWAEAQASGDPGPRADARLAGFVKECMKVKLISEDILEKTLPANLIEKLQIPDTTRAAKTPPENREKSLSYSLPRPYLFHQNCEGYSRLLSFLVGFDWREPIIEKLDAGIKRILGKHELAPERVLDILLALMAEGKAREAICGYAAKTFSEPALSSVLAFKTRFSLGTDRGPVPGSLIRACAFLIKSRAVPLESIYENLPGADENLRGAWARYLESTEKKLSSVKLDPIQIGAKSNPVSNAPQMRPGFPHFVCPGGHVDEIRSAVPSVKFPACVSCGDKALDRLYICKVCVWAACGECVRKDTKFRLYTELMMENDFESAEWIAENVGRDFVNSHPVARNAAFSKIEKLVANFEAAPDYGFGSLTAFLDEVNTSLALVQTMLHLNRKLFVKICRVFAKIIRKSSEKELISKLKAALKTCILPTLQALESSYSYSNEVWRVLGKMEYGARYELYGWWLNEPAAGNAAANWSAKVSLLQCMRFRKMSLHREEKRQVHSAKAMLKFLHNNTVPVLNDLLENVMYRGYEAVITYLIGSFKYASSLVMDATIFCVLNILCDPTRQKIEETGLFVPIWLTNLTEFVSKFVKEYPSTDFRPLVEYIFRSTDLGSVSNLFTFQALLREMGSVQIMNVMELAKENEKRTCYPGVLKSACLEGVAFFENSNSYKNLRSSIFLFAIYDTQYITQFLIALGRNICAIFWHSFLEETPEFIQLLSFQHTVSISTFTALLDFLQSSENMSTDEYCSFIPPLDLLLGERGLRPQEVFAIVRKILFSEKYFLNCTGGDQLKTFEPDALKIECRRYIENVIEAHFAIRKKGGVITPSFFALFWSEDLASLVSAKSLEKMYKKASQELSKAAKSSGNKDIVQAEENVQTKLAKERKARESARERAGDTFSLLNCPGQCFFKEKADQAFLELCIIPRCIYTPHDAVYCAKFLFMVFTRKTKGASYSNFATGLTELLPAVLHCSTAEEASNFGRFLREFLSKSLKLCANRDGFGAISEHNPCFTHNSGRIYDIEEFMYIFLRVQERFFMIFAKILAESAKKELLNNTNIGIMNTAHILKQITPLFPHFSHHSAEIKMLVERLISELDNFSSLKAILKSLLGLLERNKNTVNAESFSRIHREKMQNRKMEAIRKTMQLKKGENPNPEKSFMAAPAGSRGADAVLRTEKTEDAAPKRDKRDARKRAEPGAQSLVRRRPSREVSVRSSKRMRK